MPSSMISRRRLHRLAGVLTLFVAGTPLVSAFTDPTPWYDGNWTRRDLITVAGSPAGAQTNYPVKLTIQYDAAIKADFSDLRFADSDGTSLLSYWVEAGTNSTSVLVWVKIPAVPP